jgi:hypothetical protein
VAHIEEALGLKMILPEQPQIAGALGAALFALDDYRREGATRRQADAQIEAALDDPANALACKPSCVGKDAPIQLHDPHQ